MRKFLSPFARFFAVLIGMSILAALSRGVSPEILAVQLWWL